MDINKCNIRLYLENETAFDHNKYPLKECISCYVTESVDGVLDLEMEYPLKDKKNISGLLKRKNIIKCPISTTDKRGEQLFKIRTTTPNTSNTVIKVYAQAIARRDLDKFNMVIDLKTTPGITRKQAIGQILSHCAKQHKFYVGNLDTNTITNINMGIEEETGSTINYLTINGISPRSAFLSENENSIYKAWGGEVIWNNFEINMVDERGSDNSFEIRSGKNLQELEQIIDDTDLDNFVTAIMPVSSDGVYLPNHEIIYSPNHSILEGGFLKLVCDDVSLVENTPAGFNVVYVQLRSRVQKKFNEDIDKLKINNTVKFIQLANTEEYKDFKKLERCEIGNNVTIKYYDPFDPQKKIYIEAIGRVLKIKFNVLTNRIDEVEIGDRKKKTIIDKITNTDNATNDLNDKHNDNKKKIKAVKKYTNDSINTINTHIVKMEARDDSIELSVEDLAKNTKAALEIQDEEIALSVKKEEFGAYLKMHYNEIMMAVFDGTNHTVTLNKDGLSVGNGAFTVRDDNGNIVFRVNLDNVTGVRDLSLSNEAYVKGSSFYNSLKGMKEVWLQKLSVGQFIMDEKDFYIYHDDQGGYDLESYVNTLCYKMLKNQGLI